MVLKIYDLDDGETDDDDCDRLGFSCPFWQELFDETDLAKEHVIKHLSDEENRSVADDEDEDFYSKKCLWGGDGGHGDDGVEDDDDNTLECCG